MLRRKKVTIINTAIRPTVATAYYVKAFNPRPTNISPSLFFQNFKVLSEYIMEKYRKTLKVIR
jgi:hypothetical protein